MFLEYLPEVVVQVTVGKWEGKHKVREFAFAPAKCFSPYDLEAICAEAVQAAREQDAQNAAQL